MLIDTDREWQAPVIGPHHLLKEAFDGGNIALRYSRMNSIVFRSGSILLSDKVMATTG